MASEVFMKSKDVCDTSARTLFEHVLLYQNTARVDSSRMSWTYSSSAKRPADTSLCETSYAVRWKYVHIVEIHTNHSIYE